MAYQTQQMRERLTFGRVHSGFASRFKQDNPELADLSRRQYNIAQQRVRDFERREGEIPAQPIRNSDVGQSPDGPVSSSGGSGSDEPPEAPPLPMEEFPEPRRNNVPTPAANRQASPTVPPPGTKAVDFFVERAGLGRVPTDAEAYQAIDTLREQVPAYEEMFQGQWAVPDPEFDRLYSSMTDEQRQAWNTVMANHHAQEKGSWTPYKESALSYGPSKERWSQSKLLQDGNISLEEFNAAYGTKGRDPVGWTPDRPSPGEGLLPGETVDEWGKRASAEMDRRAAERAAFAVRPSPAGSCVRP